MNKLVMLVLLLVCLVNVEAAWKRCKGKRPEFCTEQYKPVCGMDVRHTLETYGNKCMACANVQVMKYKKGECEEDQ